MGKLPLTYGTWVQYITVLTLAVTVLTAVPLFITYLNGTDGPQLVTDIHVWMGMFWVVSAGTNFLVFKRPLFQFRRHLP